MLIKRCSPLSGVYDVKGISWMMYDDNFFLFQQPVRLPRQNEHHWFYEADCLMRHPHQYRARAVGKNSGANLRPL